MWNWDPEGLNNLPKATYFKQEELEVQAVWLESPYCKHYARTYATMSTLKEFIK